jgi:hypothetical protein
MCAFPHSSTQLKAKSGHNGEGMLLQSPPASDSPSMPAQGGIMAPVALRAAYPAEASQQQPGLEQNDLQVQHQGRMMQHVLQMQKMEFAPMQAAR